MFFLLNSSLSPILYSYFSVVVKRGNRKNVKSLHLYVLIINESKNVPILKLHHSKILLFWISLKKSQFIHLHYNHKERRIHRQSEMDFHYWMKYDAQNVHYLLLFFSDIVTVFVVKFSDFSSIFYFPKYSVYVHKW